MRSTNGATSITKADAKDSHRRRRPPCGPGECPRSPPRSWQTESWSNPSPHQPLQYVGQHSDVEVSHEAWATSNYRFVAHRGAYRASLSPASNRPLVRFTLQARQRRCRFVLRSERCESRTQHAWAAIFRSERHKSHDDGSETSHRPVRTSRKAQFPDPELTDRTVSSDFKPQELAAAHRFPVLPQISKPRRLTELHSPPADVDSRVLGNSAPIVPDTSVRRLSRSTPSQLMRPLRH
jgi:hypothetical protein